MRVWEVTHTNRVVVLVVAVVVAYHRQCLLGAPPPTNTATATATATVTTTPVINRRRAKGRKRLSA
jgi:hypothetical protein